MKKLLSKLKQSFSKIIKKIRYKMIVRAIKNGRIFSANFTKADGSERVMCCRIGVRKNLKGKGLSYDPVKKRMVVVWDMNANGYRTIATDRLNWIKIEGRKHEFK